MTVTAFIEHLVYEAVWQWLQVARPLADDNQALRVCNWLHAFRIWRLAAA